MPVGVVRRGRRAVVRGVPDLVVVPLIVPAVPVVTPVEAVGHVPGRARRRIVAEEVTQEPPEAVHRKGL